MSWMESSCIKAIAPSVTAVAISELRLAPLVALAVANLEAACAILAFDNFLALVTAWLLANLAAGPLICIFSSFLATESAASLPAFSAAFLVEPLLIALLAASAAAFLTAILPP